MKIFLVGGAVRDRLLGLSNSDKDWVVVGASPEMLLSQGFKQVGKDFPVFLHPQTKEEYALARIERKESVGHTGFGVNFSPDVTLEQDLLRRDLTINAIAEDENGEYYDPYQGIHDIEKKVLRHISPAFAEDPLRVLRVARFAARFADLGFEIAPETLQLMRHIVEKQELQTLSAERVWLETKKALQTDSPWIYFSVLQQCGALEVLFPEVATLYLQRLDHIAGSDSQGELSLTVLKNASKISGNSDLRFAAYYYAIGRQNPFEPVSYLAEKNRELEQAITLLCQRLKIPNQSKQYLDIVVQFYPYFSKVNCFSAEHFLHLFSSLDAYRKPDNVFIFTQGASAVTMLYQPLTQCKQISHYFQTIYTLCNTPSVKSIIEAGYQGSEIQDKLYEQRKQLLTQWLQTHPLHVE